MSNSTLELIIGLVIWVIYGFVIIRLVRRWLLEGRISDTQAAFLMASRTSIAFLFGAIIVTIDSGGITTGVIFLLLFSVFVTVIGIWGLRWLVPDLRASVRRDWLRKRRRERADDQLGR